MGTVRNRGWLGAPVIYARPASDAEVAEQRACPRYLCYRYRHWDELREDEAKYGYDVDCLREHSYP